MNDDVLTGWPDQVLSEVISRIDSILLDTNIKEFYIGRTSDLEASKDRHNCDIIIPIYRSDSNEDTLVMEDTLIDLYHSHPKNSNEALHAGGGVSKEFAEYVYLVIWF